MTSRFSNLKRVVALILTLVMVISAVPVVSAAPTKTDSSDLKADVVFAIDSTGSMSDEIRNVVKNLNSFTQYLEDRDVDIRIAIIDYKDITYSGERDSTVLHLKDYSPWYYTADDAAAVLSSLRVDGGGDGPETAVDALGCLLSDDIMFRSDAHKFAVLLTDYSYKNNNDYGYESMSEVVEELVDEKIYTSVITTSSFKSTYADLFEKTGGIYGDIYGDFGSILKELAERIFGITTKVTRAIYILPGYMGSQLYDDGELAWINMDVDMSDPFANPLINDIANNLLPGGESSKFAQNEDGTGIRVGVDIEDDQYGFSF